MFKVEITSCGSSGQPLLEATPASSGQASSLSGTPSPSASGQGQPLFAASPASSGQAVIQKIKGILDSYPTAKFVVEGHASSDGSKGYNQKLSENRANAVQEALVAAGADAARISTAAFGEDRPIGDNNTAAGRKSNRRVQFSVGE